ncbi:crossover junction endodeoxyribonuclease RuvC [bacterium]|nr:crossover junction endodeoxyribonuclease RuvC [bacterium]
MIIMGIDPGTNTTGFGIVRYEKNRLECLTSGIIKLPDSYSLPRKLERIYDNMVDIIELYHPKECAIEDVFFSKNVKSSLKLGHARGAAMLGALHHDIHISEYSAKEIKMAVVGNGNASKEQVRFMVKKILDIQKEMTFDESDALGIAICHAHRVKSPRASVKSWSAYIKAHPERVKSG